MPRDEDAWKGREGENPNAPRIQTKTTPEVVEKKEGRGRGKQMPSPHRSRPRMRGGEGENRENKARRWKIKQRIQMEPSKSRCLAAADARIPSLILPFPSLPDREQLRGVSAAPEPPSAPVFFGICCRKQSGGDGNGWMGRTLPKGLQRRSPSQISVIPCIISIALSVSLYQHPLISLAPLPLCSFQSEIFQRKPGRASPGSDSSL